MNEKGMCKEHGEFILADGCPACLRKEARTSQEVEAICEPSIQSEEAPTALVRVKPELDIEIQSFYDQTVMLKEYAEKRVIARTEHLKPATDDLSIIAKVRKALEEKRKDYLKPLQEYTKEINEAFKTLMEPIESADKTTRNKILAFQQEQARLRQEQEEINRQKAELAAREAALNGREVEPVELVEVTPEAPKRIETDMGTVGQRDNWKWEVVDFALVPDSYKMINAGVLTPVVKASKGKIEIPGVRIFNEPIIAVNAR